MTNVERHPKSGVYRVRRTVPRDLRAHLPRPYTGRASITKTLGTKDEREARRLARQMAAEIDRLFEIARGQAAGALATDTASLPSPKDQSAPDGMRFAPVYDDVRRKWVWAGSLPTLAHSEPLRSGQGALGEAGVVSLEQVLTSWAKQEQPERRTPRK